jgi:hypothetical protein
VTGTPNTPAAIITEALRVAQSRIDNGNDVINDRRALMDNIGILVGQFTIAYLMELLSRVAPAVADAAAKDLADIWDDGGVINEMIWEWRDDLAHGRPIGITFERVIIGGAL